MPLSGFAFWARILAFVASCHSRVSVRCAGGADRDRGQRRAKGGVSASAPRNLKCAALGARCVPSARLKAKSPTPTEIAAATLPATRYVSEGFGTVGPYATKYAACTHADRQNAQKSSTVPLADRRPNPAFCPCSIGMNAPACFCSAESAFQSPRISCLTASRAARRSASESDGHRVSSCARLTAPDVAGLAAAAGAAAAAAEAARRPLAAPSTAMRRRPNIVDLKLKQGGEEGWRSGTRGARCFFFARKRGFCNVTALATRPFIYHRVAATATRGCLLPHGPDPEYPHSHEGKRD